MQITSIEILNIRILEPVTLLTDVFTATLSFFLFYKLYQGQKRSHSSKTWSVFFLFFGISTFFSGFAHGFMDYSGKLFLYFAWVLGCIGVYAMELSSSSLIKRKKLRILVNYLIFLKLLITTAIIFFFGNFLAVTLSSALGLLVLKLSIRIVNYYRYRESFDKYIIIGIAVSTAPALIHTLRLSISEWFNHKDLSHLILAISILFFYKGAVLEFQKNTEEELELTPA